MKEKPPDGVKCWALISVSVWYKKGKRKGEKKSLTWFYYSTLQKKKKKKERRERERKRDHAPSLDMSTLDAYNGCPFLDLQDSQTLRKEINIQPVSNQNEKK